MVASGAGERHQATNSFLAFHNLGLKAPGIISSNGRRASLRHWRMKEERGRRAVALTCRMKNQA